ncbi:MAG: OsmC family protein [Candidatus Eisenbacteria bacterium]|uniref:OsmC family protein n=1 Tax=Eiseniibacteriota bacterium TaxID=2212470 RepID=A0A956RNE6_UNCEI|nr:OsmC family protein [Candidatus Eisenbacteria bacterium]
MLITAWLKNSGSLQETVVSTAGAEKSVPIPTKSGGRGSSVNGGELLMLALATCYCNDLYREADRLGIEVTAVEVEVHATFAGVGLAATGIQYRARVDSPAPAEEIARLLRETDAVAEIQNTVRSGVDVVLTPWDADS